MTSRPDIRPLLPTALLCFDFDGTLVDRDSDPRFDPRLAAYLDELAARGAAWVINSGRSLLHVLEGLMDHGIPVTPDFIIAREHEIFARHTSGQWIDCGDWNDRCRRRHERFFRQHRTFLRAVRAFVEDRDHAAWIEATEEPAGLVARSEAAMVEIISFVESHRLSYPELGYQRNSIYLRFTHRDFDKGTALQELARHLDITPKGIFAAGDNYNDLSMLRGDIARRLCCPGNALPEVKAQVLREGGLVAAGHGSRGMIEGLEHYYFSNLGHDAGLWRDRPAGEVS
jgi:HAD superfamily hydrolase (TIGR01484 family)